MEEQWTGLIYSGINFSDKFFVSNTGEIKNIKTNKILKQYKNKRGYMQIVVSLGSRNSSKKLSVHRAILESFYGIEPNKLDVNHIDFNRSNNTLSNLEWCTAKENYEHSKIKIIAGHPRGTAHYLSKLNAEKIDYIRTSYIPYNKIYGIRALSRELKVHHRTIEDVLSSRTWNFQNPLLTN
jgi:hypothetical protein